MFPGSRHSLDFYEKKLGGLLNRNNRLGFAVRSEISVVNFEGRRTSSDMCIIDVTELGDRVMQNSIYVPSEIEGIKFRSYRGDTVYVVGEAPLSVIRELPKPDLPPDELMEMSTLSIIMSNLRIVGRKRRNIPW